jgi:hypothetical protein
MVGQQALNLYMVVRFHPPQPEARPALLTRKGEMSSDCWYYCCYRCRMGTHFGSTSGTVFRVYCRDRFGWCCRCCCRLRLHVVGRAEGYAYLLQVCQGREGLCLRSFLLGSGRAWPGPLFILGGVFMVVSDTVSVYVTMIQMALPFTFIFWGGEMIVTTFLRTAFGGKLSFKV